VAVIEGDSVSTVSNAAATILALVAADGTCGSPYARALRHPATPLRDQADAVHALCIVHGTLPGVIDHVLAGAADPQAQDWLISAAAAMAGERVTLARLTAAVGPLPSTPHQAASEAAIIGQCHALEMLSQSDRRGCATGTAIAFVLDWAAVRDVLDACARRLGLDVALPFTPVAADARRFLSTVATTPSSDRAMAFGAQQMLAQHRGLWQLLEARATARDGARGAITRAFPGPLRSVA
jgi:hypothetical protein